MDTAIAYESNATDFARDLTALARLVTFARHCARDLNLKLPAYCLDVALMSILEEVEKSGIDLKEVAAKDDYGVPAAFH
jgi:hypothetical protein